MVIRRPDLGLFACLRNKMSYITLIRLKYYEDIRIMFGD